MTQMCLLLLKYTTLFHGLVPHGENSSDCDDKGSVFLLVSHVFNGIAALWPVIA